MIEKKHNHFIWVVAGILLITLCLLIISRTYADGSIASLDGKEITIYGFDSSSEAYIGAIPASYDQTYQIDAPQGSTFSVVYPGNSATVDSTGLVSVKYTTWYYYDGYRTTAPSSNPDDVIRIEDDMTAGDTTIKVSYGNEIAYITVHVFDYAATYVDSILYGFISQNITPNMTTYEKLDTIAKYIAETYDYSITSSHYVSMVLQGGGDCIASTTAIIRMCEMLGLDARVRIGYNDPLAGNNHRNAIVYDDGMYYVVDAGYAGMKPRHYELTAKDAPFSYKMYPDDYGYTIYQYDGEDNTGTLIIPETINGIPVTGLEHECFKGTGFSEIVLPDTLKTIRYSALSYCSNLTTLNIPASVETIESGFLMYCSRLENLTVDPANNNYASANGIIFSKDMTEILFAPGVNNPEIPETVATIGLTAFRGNSRLTSIQIPASATEIKAGAFYYCSKLSNLVLPASITTIGDRAFGGCSSIQNIWYTGTEEQWNQIAIDTGNDSLTSCPNIFFQSEGPTSSYTYSNGTLTIKGTGVMEGYASSEGTPWADFKDSITRVVVEDGITDISNYAFSELVNLRSVSLPETLVSIGKYAFLNCASLEAIELSQSMNNIGDYAFRYCTGLKTVSFPAQMESIGAYAFNGCTGLSSLTLPRQMTSIGTYAFNGCSSLVAVAMPDQMESLGTYAFYGCKSLATIMMPGQMTSIGRNAFDGCSSLMSVVIPEGITVIEPYTFSYCQSLATVTFPDSLISIGSSAFTYCSSLTELNFPANLTEIGGSAFSRCSKLISLNTGESSLTTIGRSAFYGNSKLLYIILPDSLTTIADGAFSDCYKIQKVWYEGTQAQWEQISIGSDNEYLTGCASIIYQSQGPQMIGSVQLPLYVGQSVEIPGFDECTLTTTDYSYVTRLTGKTITARKSGNAIVHVRGGEDVFLDYIVTVYSSPAKLILPSSLTTIETEAFERDYHLQFVEMGSAVQVVEPDAFVGSGILQIVVPSTATVFDAGAFGNTAPLIVCTAGSAAETFAEQNGYTYVYMAN